MRRAGVAMLLHSRIYFRAAEISVQFMVSRISYDQMERSILKNKFFQESLLSLKYS